MSMAASRLQLTRPRRRNQGERRAEQAWSDQKSALKSPVPRDWRPILGRWIARAFVYAAAATARRDGTWKLSGSQASEPELLADEVPRALA